MKPIILCSRFTDSSDLSPLGSNCPALSAVFLYLQGLAEALERDVGSGTGRWLRGSLGRPPGVDFELEWVWETFFKVQLKPVWENVFYRLDFLMAYCLGP